MSATTMADPMEAAELVLDELVARFNEAFGYAFDFHGCYDHETRHLTMMEEYAAEFGRTDLVEALRAARLNFLSALNLREQGNRFEGRWR